MIDICLSPSCHVSREKDVGVSKVDMADLRVRMLSAAMQTGGLTRERIGCRS